MIKSISVDLSKNGKFYAQMCCIVVIKQKLLHNEVINSFNMQDIIEQIEEKYPSLIGKNYQIHLNSQKL